MQFQKYLATAKACSPFPNLFKFGYCFTITMYWNIVQLHHALFIVPINIFIEPLDMIYFIKIMIASQQYGTKLCLDNGCAN